METLSVTRREEEASQSAAATAPSNSARLNLTSTRLERWRWVALAIVLALVLLHQLFLSFILARLAPAWRLPVEASVYSLTGIVGVWVGMTALARAFARREQAETQLRAAFAELEFNHQKLLALHDIGENLAEADDEQSVLELAAQAPLKIVEARASTVVTFDDDHNRLNLDMAWGLSDRYLQALRTRIDAGIPAGRCRRCATLHAEAASDCPLFTGLHSHAQAEGIGSLICLPIAHERERVGLIAAYFPSASGPAEDHVRLLNILGGAIAASLHSLRTRARQVNALHALDRAAILQRARVS